MKPTLVHSKLESILGNLSEQLATISEFVEKQKDHNYIEEYSDEIWEERNECLGALHDLLFNDSLEAKLRAATLFYKINYERNLSKDDWSEMFPHAKPTEYYDYTEIPGGRRMCRIDARTGKALE